MFVAQKPSNHVPNPVRGCMFIVAGPTGHVRPSVHNAPGMQPHNAAGGLSVLSVSINMQPQTGLGTSVGEFGAVKLTTPESAIKSIYQDRSGG
jgi:hypothetical protein